MCHLPFTTLTCQIHSIDVPEHSLDVVLVDGRARAPCALTAIPYLSQHATLIIHDFTWRPYYHVVLKYFDLIKTVKTLVLLKPKPSVWASPPNATEIRSVCPTKFK